MVEIAVFGGDIHAILAVIVPQLHIAPFIHEVLDDGFPVVEAASVAHSIPSQAYGIHSDHSLVHDERCNIKVLVINSHRESILAVIIRKTNVAFRDAQEVIGGLQSVIHAALH